MSQLKLSFEFSNASGNVIPELSKDFARPEDLMAALSFMQDGFQIVVKVEKTTVGADE